MKIICKFGSGTGIVLATCSVAIASDLPTRLPLKAPVRSVIYDWTGFYLGGHVGYGGGSFGPGTDPLPEQGVFFPHSITGLIGGFQGGYNRQFANNVVLGVEADVLFMSPIDGPRLMPTPFHTTFDYFATARGRLGYASGSLLPYVTAGVGSGQTHGQLDGVGGRGV